MHTINNSVDYIALMCNYVRMAKEDQITRLTRAWVLRIGRLAATVRLINRGFAVSTAEKICASRYSAPMRPLYAAALLDEMAKDGFKLAGEKAS